MGCRSPPKTSRKSGNRQKYGTKTRTQHFQHLLAPYGQPRRKSASKFPIAKVACAAGCSMNGVYVCTLTSSDSPQPTQIARTMNKHPALFRGIMRDTSHFKARRSRLVGCSAAGQICKEVRGFRSIPGRFIVASVDSGNYGGF
jgi:hypothetical protein